MWHIYNIEQLKKKILNLASEDASLEQEITSIEQWVKETQFSNVLLILDNSDQFITDTDHTNGCLHEFFWLLKNGKIQVIVTNQA